MMDKGKKTKTGLYLDCPCGAKAAVFESGECRWYSHCPGCGRLTFWANPQLTERIKAGGKLCLHDPELKTCKDGKSMTSWCRACRVRVFVPSDS
jgi:hypothetical protein